MSKPRDSSGGSGGSGGKGAHWIIFAAFGLIILRVVEQNTGQPVSAAIS